MYDITHLRTAAIKGRQHAQIINKINDGLTSEPFAGVRVLGVAFSVSGLKSSTGRYGRVPLWQVPSWRMASVG